MLDWREGAFGKETLFWSSPAFNCSSVPQKTSLIPRKILFSSKILNAFGHIFWQRTLACVIENNQRMVFEQDVLLRILRIATVYKQFWHLLCCQLLEEIAVCFWTYWNDFPNEHFLTIWQSTQASVFRGLPLLFFGLPKPSGFPIRWLRTSDTRFG